MLLSAVVLGGCSSAPVGCQSELTGAAWRASLEGGAEVRLRFEDGAAHFRIENAGESADISGQYLVDAERFVIFVPEVGQNYAFDYTPKGDTLELRWEGGVLTLQKDG